MTDNTSEAPRRRGRRKKEEVLQTVDSVAETMDFGQEITVSAADPAPRPMRQPMREPMREDDLARAQRRAAEIMGTIDTLDDGVDEFRINPKMIPDGWTYEWKRKTVMGQEDVGYQTSLARMGWDPVNVNKDHDHRALMGADWKGRTIERKGMILMERPKVITEEARRLERQRARGQVTIKEEQLSAAPPGQFERNNKDSSLAKVKKGYEPMPIPEK